MASWPNSLPKGFLLDTLSEQISDTGVRRFTPEVGDDLTRDASTALITELQYDIVVTAEQWETLWEFYLDNRALVFTMSHPDANIAGSKRFTFKSAPARRALPPGHYRVSLHLTYLPSTS